MRRLLPVTLLLFLAACGTPPVADVAPTPEPTSTPTASPTATPLTPTPPLPPTFAPAPAPTPTPAWTFQQGEIVCPILLYHRIAVPPEDDPLSARYYVAPADFRAQMEALRAWGYTAIPISLLVRAITVGAELPERPVVITFDDGDLTVYQQAFPVMRAQGFPGVFYLVDKYLGAEGFVNEEQVREMAAAGWEIGSHSMTHVDVRLAPERLQVEGRQSRLSLERRLGLPVETFAYPFGGFDASTGEKIRKYGYSAAVGLGTSYRHSPGTLFYLSRIEVRQAYSLEDLAARLPWSGP